MLTYVLDSEISPQNNVVKISINFLRRPNWRRKTPGKVDSWTLSSFRLFNQKNFQNLKDQAYFSAYLSSIFFIRSHQKINTLQNLLYP